MCSQYANGVHLSAIWHDTWHNCKTLHFKLHQGCDIGWYRYTSHSETYSTESENKLLFFFYQQTQLPLIILVHTKWSRAENKIYKFESQLKHRYKRTLSWERFPWGASQWFFGQNGRRLSREYSCRIRLTITWVVEWKNNTDKTIHVLKRNWWYFMLTLRIILLNKFISILNHLRLWIAVAMWFKITHICLISDQTFTDFGV